MSLKKLVFTEIRVAFDWKFLSFFVIILLVSTAFPFYSITRFLGEEMLQSGIPDEMKRNIGGLIDGSLLIRFSLTVYLLAAWGFIPKMFYNSKLMGEVESVLAIGYSGRKIWLSKSVAVMMTSICLAVPLILILSVFFRWYCNYQYHLWVPFHVVPFLFSVVINPLLLAALILFVGAFQLLSDDVRKSSMSIFVLGILNIGLMFGGNMKDLAAMQRTYGTIYGIAFAVLVAAILWLNTRMESENIMMSTLRKIGQGGESSWTKSSFLIGLKRRSQSRS